MLYCACCDATAYPHSKNEERAMSASSSLLVRRLVFGFLAIGIFVLDQATKYPFRTSWQVHQSAPALSSLGWPNSSLAFTYVQNTGSLFGIFQGNAFWLGLISLSMSIGIIWYALKQRERDGWLPFITLGFLLGGALGNMLDRLMFGFVVDFFDIQMHGRNVWPVFNVADIAVDVAIALFVIMAIFEPKPLPKGSENIDAPFDAPASPEMDSPSEVSFPDGVPHESAEKKTDA
jgi:signal peptidase II